MYLLYQCVSSWTTAAGVDRSSIPRSCPSCRTSSARGRSGACYVRPSRRASSVRTARRASTTCWERERGVSSLPVYGSWCFTVYRFIMSTGICRSWCYTVYRFITEYRYVGVDVLSFTVSLWVPVCRSWCFTVYRFIMSTGMQELMFYRLPFHYRIPVCRSWCFTIYRFIMSTGMCDWYFVLCHFITGLNTNKCFPCQ